MRRASSCPDDDVDREAERRFGLRQELAARCAATRNVLVATARTADGCRPRRRSPKRARQRQRRALRRRRLMRPCSIEAGAEAQRLAPRVEAEDLVAFDAAELEAEAVRAQVDDGERLGRASDAACADGSMARREISRSERGSRMPRSGTLA